VRSEGGLTLSLYTRLLRTGTLSGMLPQQLLDHPWLFLDDRMVSTG